MNRRAIPGLPRLRTRLERPIKSPSTTDKSGQMIDSFVAGARADLGI